ncbi:MAG: NPCBM/NEW2 domain-containing protein [Gemmataceae bacterium]
MTSRCFGVLALLVVLSGQQALNRPALAGVARPELLRRACGTVDNRLLEEAERATRYHALATPRFTLERADGKELSGTLEEIGPNWSITLGGADLVPGRDVIALARQGTRRPPRPVDEHVVLVGGALVPGRADDLTGETLRFQARLDGDKDLDWKLGLSAVALVWIAAPEGTKSAEALARQLAAARRGRDQVHLRNGDVLEGILISFARKDQLKIEVKGREVAVEFNKVAVIALNTDLQRVPKTKQHGHVVLASGARLELATLKANERTATGKTIHGNPVEFPVADLVALDMRGGPVAYLSDLKPTLFQFTPFLDLEWSYVNDGSVAGSDLRLGGHTFDKGVGVHAASKLTYAVPAGSRRFEALVGLDDRTGREGTARLEVLVDGKPRKLPWDGSLLGGKPPQELRVDLDGAKEVTLLVDFGPRGNVQAHVDFAQARFVK